MKRGKRSKGFPGIGKPGAEKVLLFTRGEPVLALDSNGVRVLARLGFGEEKRNYDATYRAVQQAASASLPKTPRALVRAHLLLRKHGQETCKTNAPRCEACVAQPACDYYRRHRVT